MKYKVGDKVLIKATITEDEYGLKYPFDVTVGNHSRFSVSEDDIASKTYEDGLNDAWELARKIMYGLTRHQLKEIFGTDNEVGILSDAYTPQEALAKIEAYEKSQIKVGDVVTTTNGTCKYIVTNIQEPNTLHVINSQNGYVQQMRKDVVKKTGKTVDIQHLLEQIRGNE